MGYVKVSRIYSSCIDIVKNSWIYYGKIISAYIHRGSWRRNHDTWWFFFIRTHWISNTDYRRISSIYFGMPVRHLFAKTLAYIRCIFISLLDKWSVHKIFCLLNYLWYVIRCYLRTAVHFKLNQNGSAMTHFPSFWNVSEMNYHIDVDIRPSIITLYETLSCFRHQLYFSNICFPMVLWQVHH